MFERKIDRFTRSLFAKDILKQLRIDIISGALPAKHRLVENQLAQQYGVSRGPIRSAIQALEQQGLIQSLPTGGAEVIGFPQKHALDLFEVRQNIEVMAANLIFQRNDQDISFAGLKAVMDAMFKPDVTIEQLGELDMAFHLEFIKLADNWAILQTWLNLSPIIYDILTFTNRIYEHKDQIASNHTGILQALETRNLDMLLREIRSHIQVSKKLIAERFKLEI